MVAQRLVRKAESSAGDLGIQFHFAESFAEGGGLLVGGGVGVGLVSEQLAVELAERARSRRSRALLVGFEDLGTPRAFEFFVFDAEGLGEGVELVLGFLEAKPVDARVGLHEQAHLGTGAAAHVQMRFQLSVIFLPGVYARFKALLVAITHQNAVGKIIVRPFNLNVVNRFCFLKMTA